MLSVLTLVSSRYYGQVDGEENVNGAVWKQVNQCAIHKEERIVLGEKKMSFEFSLAQDEASAEGIVTVIIGIRYGIVLYLRYSRS